MPRVQKIEKCSNCGAILEWLIPDPKHIRIIHNVLYFGCPDCKKVFQYRVNYYSGEVKSDGVHGVNYNTFPRIDPKLKVTQYPKFETKCPQCKGELETYNIDTHGTFGAIVLHCQNCKKLFTPPGGRENEPSATYLPANHQIQEFIARAIEKGKEPLEQVYCSNCGFSMKELFPREGAKYYKGLKVWNCTNEACNSVFCEHISPASKTRDYLFQDHRAVPEDFIGGFILGFGQILFNSEESFNAHLKSKGKVKGPKTYCLNCGELMQMLIPDTNKFKPDPTKNSYFGCPECKAVFEDHHDPLSGERKALCISSYDMASFPHKKAED